MIKMEATNITASVTAEGDSPWFSGHFPNNPILPGIAQLKMVVDCITKRRESDMCLTGLSRVKFRKIVRPGERLDIWVTGGDTEDHCMFKITCGDEDVCSGKMLFAHNKKQQP